MVLTFPSRRRQWAQRALLPHGHSAPGKRNEQGAEKHFQAIFINGSLRALQALTARKKSENIANNLRKKYFENPKAFDETIVLPPADLRQPFLFPRYDHPYFLSRGGGGIGYSSIWKLSKERGLSYWVFFFFSSPAQWPRMTPFWTPPYRLQCSGWKRLN